MLEGVTNPTVVSAPFRLIIDMDESSCELGSTTVTAEWWIDRFSVIIDPSVNDYEFEQQLFYSSSAAC